uniref:Integrase core domain-containing protein n=1 Tax=Amphimedon queenslandica TaxID=400682 RepID=A0A1X7UVR7_AMPQE
MAERGRRRFDIDRNNVFYLRSLHFKWTEISQILGVSKRTLCRRAREWNLPLYSVITDQEIDSIVVRHLTEFHAAGEAMLRGYLTSQAVRVQRERLRRSVRRARGDDNQILPAISRRIYLLPGLNYLWHIDGHHKLIKWRLVTHGGIDGFSRLITYLKCSNNNRSETVTKSFIEATRQYGVPLCVRSDHGAENVGVWSFIEEARGRNHNSYIAGRSVHNCRIERLWRDVYTAVTTSYVVVFTQLEQEGLLDPENETDTASTISLFHALITFSIYLCKHGLIINCHQNAIGPLCSCTQVVPLVIHCLRRRLISVYMELMIQMMFLWMKTQMSPLLFHLLT